VAIQKIVGRPSSSGSPRFARDDGVPQDDGLAVAPLFQCGADWAGAPETPPRLLPFDLAATVLGASSVLTVIRIILTVISEIVKIFVCVAARRA
jgi:hypothetical protein